MPIDLGQVDWLYVAVLAVFAFVANFVANLLSFNHRLIAAAGYGARTICLHSDGKPANVSGGFGLRGGECSVDSLNQKSSRG
jgi:hypothetical protein